MFPSPRNAGAAMRILCAATLLAACGAAPRVTPPPSTFAAEPPRGSDFESTGAPVEAAAPFAPREIVFRYVVRPEDTLRSINTRFGVEFYGPGLRLYAHPLNAELRRRNPNPEILEPGSVVFIADRTDSIGLRILENSLPSPNTPYRFFLEGIEVDGENRHLDRDGDLDERLPVGVLHAQVHDGTWRPLTMSLNPPSTILGIQERLANLGFGARATGKLDDSTRAALRSFQGQHRSKRDSSSLNDRLTPTDAGIADDPLVVVHASAHREIVGTPGFAFKAKNRINAKATRPDKPAQYGLTKTKERASTPPTKPKQAE
jgi:hypothetical protein